MPRRRAPVSVTASSDPISLFWRQRPARRWRGLHAFTPDGCWSAKPAGKASVKRLGGVSPAVSKTVASIAGRAPGLAGSTDSETRGANAAWASGAHARSAIRATRNAEGLCFIARV